jgi:hypothetical protein
VYFLTAIGRRAGSSLSDLLRLYDGSYGQPTATMREGLAKAYDDICGVDSFYWVTVTRVGPTMRPTDRARTA